MRLNRLTSLLLLGTMTLSVPQTVYAVESGNVIEAEPLDVSELESSIGNSSEGSYAINVYNVDADYAIEADVQINRSSGGSVAKLVIFGGTAAMSFDIVEHSISNTTYLYRENIHHNGAGGQEYSAINQYPSVESGQTYHLMIAYRKDGQGTVYLNGELLDTFYNPEMTAFSDFDPAVEACGMRDGSTVDASFSNITIKKGDKISSYDWNTRNMDNNPGLHSDVSTLTVNGTVRIQGTLQLARGEDWDSAYDGVSGKVYFT